MSSDTLWFKNKKRRNLFIVFAILSVAVMIMIFMFSTENADESNGTSGEVIDLVLTLVYEDYENIPPQEKANLISDFQSIVRPMAHGTVYFVLGFMYAGTLWQLGRPKVYIRLYLAWIFSVIYAISDEMHQYFVPGRAFEFKDILVDSLGALLGVALLWVFGSLFSKGKKTVEKKCI